MARSDTKTSEAKTSVSVMDVDADALERELVECFSDGPREDELTLDQLYEKSKATCTKGAFYRRFEMKFVDTGKYIKVKRIVNGKKVNAYKPVE